MLKKCPFCNRFVNDPVHVCPHCGKTLKDDAIISNDKDSLNQFETNKTKENVGESAEKFWDKSAIGQNAKHKTVEQEITLQKVDVKKTNSIVNQSPVIHSLLKKEIDKKVAYIVAGIVGITLIILGLSYFVQGEKTDITKIFNLNTKRNTQEETLIPFSLYEKEESIKDIEGVFAGMTLGIDIPQGKGEVVDKITRIIRTLITSSEIGEQIGPPMKGSLNKVCDDYVERFKKGIAYGNLMSGCAYHLEILYTYQTSEYICFHVVDGVYGNGGPMEREVLVRLSDEHFLEQDEIINIPEEKLLSLAKKYASEDQKETAENMRFLMSYELVPDERGCKFHYASQGIHIFDVMYFPVEEIEQYLTEEGRKVFGLSEGIRPEMEQEDNQFEVVVGEGLYGSLQNGTTQYAGDMAGFPIELSITKNEDTGDINAFYKNVKYGATMNLSGESLPAMEGDINFFGKTPNSDWTFSLTGTRGHITGNAFGDGKILKINLYLKK